MRVDAHCHLWRLARGDYAWLTPELGALYRDFECADLMAQLDLQGIDAAVLVQAAATVAETHFLLAIADSEPRIAGVVGWIDFAAPGAADELAELARHPRFCGVRPMIQDIAEERWMLRSELGPAFEALAQSGLAFDALVLPRHLPHLLTLCKRHPRLRVVVDHAAKPRIASWSTADSEFAAWRDALAGLAATGAHCKLSGLVTEAGTEAGTEAKAGPTTDRLRPYAAELFELFGPERILWGSDWPVVELACGYQAWSQIAAELTQAFDAASQSLVYGGNATRFYRLSPRP